MAEYLPDTAIRKRVFDAFQQLAPKPGRLVRKMYMPTETEPDRETLNGELIEINFADRQITILPKGSNRPRLGLNAFAGAVSDLLEEVAEDLVVVWKALELKHRLLSVMEEVPVAG